MSRTQEGVVHDQVQCLSGKCALRVTEEEGAVRVKWRLFFFVLEVMSIYERAYHSLHE